MIHGGMTFNGAALARHLGVSRTTFYKALKSGRLDRCGKGRHVIVQRSKATPELVAAMKADGKTFGEIAVDLRVTQARAIRLFIEASHG